MHQSDRALLVLRGQRLEHYTLAWNVVGVGVLAWTALVARSVALGGFGIDSVIEIGASMVVISELRGDDAARRKRNHRLIGVAFALLAIYLLVQGVVVLVDGHRAGHSVVGLTWTALTVIAMASLARAKTDTGIALANPVLVSEGRVTFVDAVLAAAVFVGVALNTTLHWWWADPIAGFVLVVYATKECMNIFRTRENSA